MRDDGSQDIWRSLASGTAPAAYSGSALPPPPPSPEAQPSFAAGRPAGRPPSRRRWPVLTAVLGSVVLLVAGALTWVVLSGAKPSNLRAVDRGYESVTLEWEWTEEARPRAFVVLRNDEEVARLPGSETRHTDGGLAPETTYEYAVLADTEGGRTRPAEITAETTAIPAPGGAQVTDEGFESATIAWEWSDADPTAFVVVRDGQEVTRVPGGESEYRDEGLEPGSSYTYAVLAETVAGRGPTTAEVVARTQALPPLAEAGLSGGYKVAVAWTAQTNFPGIQVGATRRATWFFGPQPQAPRLEASMPGAGSFSLRLKGSGPTYRGQGKAQLSNCAGLLGNDTIQVTIRVEEGEVLQDEWVASRWTGTFRLQSPSVSNGPIFCPAGSISAGLDGHGGG